MKLNFSIIDFSVECKATLDEQDSLAKPTRHKRKALRGQSEFSGYWRL